jgi:dimethylargininase
MYIVLKKEENMFKNAIVKIPSKSLINGITTSSHLGKPNYENALRQHEEYIRVLEKTGVRVTVLDADERYPDSCFV